VEGGGGWGHKGKDYCLGRVNGRSHQRKVRAVQEGRRGRHSWELQIGVVLSPFGVAVTVFHVEQAVPTRRPWSVPTKRPWDGVPANRA
jgi:hypothetical protein